MLSNEIVTNLGRQTVEINGYHVHVFAGVKKDKLVWKRTPDMPEWLDKKHKDFIEAIEKFEEATRNSIK